MKSTISMLQKVIAKAKKKTTNWGKHLNTSIQIHLNTNTNILYYTNTKIQIQYLNTNCKYYNKGINIISIYVELINQYAKASIPLMRTGWENISTEDINFYFNKKKDVTTFDDSTPPPQFEKCSYLNSYNSLEVVNHTLWPLLLRWASRRSP